MSVKGYKFLERYIDNDYETVTLYFKAPKNTFKEISKSKLSIEFPDDELDISEASVQVGPMLDDGTVTGWYDVKLTYELIEELVDLALKTEKEQWVKKIISKIEKSGWSVYKEDEECYCFGKYTPAGQDFSFSVEIGDSLQDFVDNVYDYYEDYDVSYEAYLWLDQDGHGKNGAPHEMIDVYNDMKCCEQYIYDLYELIKEEM